MAEHSSSIPCVGDAEATTLLDPNREGRSGPAPIATVTGDSEPRPIARDHDVLESQQVGPPANLKPKEHGAYAILAIPIVSALLIGGPTNAGWSVAIASFAGFFAHEPLLVLMGRRGQRAQRSTPMAKYRLLGLLVVAITTGMIAMLLSDYTQRVALVLCLLLATSSFVIAILGKHRSLAGQLWGVFGLSAPCLPILLAGDVTLADSLRIWSIFLVGFVATTLSVRGVIAAQKTQPRLTHWTVLAVLTAGVGFAIWSGWIWAAAVVPMIAMGWYLMLRPPPAKYLKRVGWSLVSATMVTAIATIVTFWHV